jgi:uncharacterized damage-inducible protein DinB
MISAFLLPEYDHEMGTTRRLLERVPEDAFAWKPHEKSMSLGTLSAHIANLPRWMGTILSLSEFDIANLKDEDGQGPPKSVAEILQAFDRNVADGRAALAQKTDAELTATWTFKRNGKEEFTVPKLGALRSFVVNHVVHHRGQLSVYLRLRNVPLPSIYGPTADEA